MAQRRAITTHPVFVPLLAIWFAALLGLGVAVLPAPARENALGTLGIGGLGPLAASTLAAAVGALLGCALAMLLARRGARDPRPIYADTDTPIEYPEMSELARRPLRVREELADGRIASSGDAPLPERAQREDFALPSALIADGGEGFMILSPQPVHPPRPAPDLDGLLAQFDTALAAFRTPEDDGPPASSGGQDPVHAFVARQTGAPAPSPLVGMGGRMPDHQAELRAALDKLAQAHRKG